ncbi:MAG: prepilin-type N-terminal cleavage/methylation domain-containing protein, partial [Algicola sp.]|nr:prepilin-type N-terminal cleavage/methylation domain-containing protein [Algicola sp.]
MSKQNGFTLIELIVVIIVIGILAVSVAPKLLTKSQFSSVAVRDQLISELRLAQLRALNDRSACYAVQVSSVDFGIYYTPVTNDVCGTSYILANSKTTLESGTVVTIGAATTA